MTRRRGLELRIRGDVTFWSCWRRKNNVWPRVVGCLICVSFLGCVSARNDRVCGRIYLSWASGIASTTTKGPFSGFNCKFIHYAIGGVSPHRPGGRASVFRRRGGHLPTAHYLGNPYVLVQHFTRVWYGYEVAATPARPPAEPVLAAGSAFPSSSTTTRTLRRAVRVPGLAGGFRREDVEYCTVTFSENVASGSLFSCMCV